MLCTCVGGCFHPASMVVRTLSCVPFCVGVVGFVVESVWVLLFSFWLPGSDSAASVFAAISVVAYY